MILKKLNLKKTSDFKKTEYELVMEQQKRLFHHSKNCNSCDEHEMIYRCNNLSYITEGIWQSCYQAPVECGHCDVFCIVCSKEDGEFVKYSKKHEKSKSHLENKLVWMNEYICPYFVKEQRNTSENCSICLLELDDNLYITECNHLYHRKCFIKCKTNICPLCRTTVKKLNSFSRLTNVSDCIVVHSDNSELDTYTSI